MQYGVMYDDDFLAEDVDQFMLLESAVERYEFALRRAEEDPEVGEFLYKNARLVQRDDLGPWVEMTDKMIEEIAR